MSLPTRLYHIFCLVLGLLFFGLAWSSWTLPPLRADSAESLQMVVRPVNASVKEDGILLQASSSKGLFALSRESAQATVEREAWGRQTVELDGLPDLSTLRLTPPLAKVQARTSNGKVVRLQILPEKEAQEPSDGYIRLKPGHYRFLAQAEGHFPQDLSLDLAAGEVRKLTVNLKAIPQTPEPPPFIPVSRPPVDRLPAQPSQPYHSLPPAARPQPRPQAQPVPLPRFTPVAPKPQPLEPAPAPLFTPLSP